eukprot:5705021-Pleurochrysis_carterae.AAC.3
MHARSCSYAHARTPVGRVCVRTHTGSHTKEHARCTRSTSLLDAGRSAWSGALVDVVEAFATNGETRRQALRQEQAEGEEGGVGKGREGGAPRVRLCARVSKIVGERERECQRRRFTSRCMHRQEQTGRRMRMGRHTVSIRRASKGYAH